MQTKLHGKNRLKVPAAIADNLQLWMDLLAKAKQGISINLIVTRRPSRVCWLDSCPFGIGGNSLVAGFAWRIQIPRKSTIYSSNHVNNLLEFLGMAINILLELKYCKREDQDCILALAPQHSQAQARQSTPHGCPTNCP
jgi:hypothetical protein